LASVEVVDGILTITGSSLEGLDLAQLIYEGPMQYRRNLLESEIFEAQVLGTLRLAGGWFRLTARDYDAYVAATHMVWEGGKLSGWASVYATETLRIGSPAQTSASLGDSAMVQSAATRLVCSPTCLADWDGAAYIDIREGAHWMNQGIFRVRGNGTVDYDSEMASWALGQEWSGRIWQTNPLCGPHCRRPPYFINTNTMTIESQANARVGLTFRHMGNLTIGLGGRLDLGGGGDDDGTWLVYGALALSGGSFVMNPDSYVGGNGTIVSTEGGPHRLADILNPRLVLDGGVIEVRSRLQELHKGLEIHDGRLAYTVSSCRVVLKEENFTMTGGEMVFVEVLPNPGIHQSHIHTDPRNADRSFFTLETKLYWSGGKMRGNCEMGARAGLVVSGEDKRLEALMHIVNYGNMYWYSGDIVLREQAGIINSGTISIHEPETHTARIVNEFTEGYYDSKLTLWEDNDGSVHQELGGFA